MHREQNKTRGVISDKAHITGLTEWDNIPVTSHQKACVEQIADAVIAADYVHSFEMRITTNMRM